jgi:hypothetical protein
MVVVYPWKSIEESYETNFRGIFPSKYLEDFETNKATTTISS